MKEGVLWVIWDGASFDVVQQLLGSGDLPALAALSGGRVLPLEPLSPNCQTPPSLASLFTGAGVLEHGVTGFRTPVPGPGASFVDVRSGFEDAALRRPLLWDGLAADGGRPGLSHVPWTAGPAGGKIALDAYDRQLAKPQLVELGTGDALDLAGRRVVARLRDGAYELSAEATGASVTVAPSRRLRFAADSLRLGPGLAIRVAVLERSGTRFLVHGGLWEMRARPAALQPAVDAAVGAFVGKTLGDAYRSGALGPRAVDGGDGSAEDGLLESARLQMDCFTGCAEVLLRSGLASELVIAYMPSLDELQHELFRWCRPRPEGERQPRAWELLRRAYALVDQHLARLLLRVGQGATVLVCSDHGAAVLRRDYRPNETLAKAGLLRFVGEGRIDVPSSQVAYHPAANGSVWVNAVDRAGGIVPQESRSAVVVAAEAALRAARDPVSGQPPVEVRRVPPAERDLLGDLFVHVRTGYECHPQPGPGGAEFADTPKGGTHTSPTGESTLRGMLAMAERGRPRDLDPGMTLMDVHAQIAGLLRRPAAG